MLRTNTVMLVFQFDDDTRQRFEEIVRPLVETHTGLKCLDSASYYEPFTVKMNLISTLIEEARLVIVDISQRNPNVFMELGIAYSLGKPLILLCSRDSWRSEWKEKLPFDLGGRELLLFKDDNELKVKLGRFISDSLHKTGEVAFSWDSASKDNYVKSSTEIEICGPGEIWSASAVNSNFIISYHVMIHEVKQKDRNPDIRLYISSSSAGYPRIVGIFPWEFSEIQQDRLECHIDYFQTQSVQERLQQVSVGFKDVSRIRNFDMFISFCYPNLVLESTFFEDKVNRLYVSMTRFRRIGYPVHLSQYIGFESKNSHVTIENIRVKEVFI